MHTISPLIAPFYEALNHGHKINEGLAADGEKFIGYFCTYTPLELLHAAGFTPVRITGGIGPVEKVYAHGPDFICPYMKRAMEDAIAGKYDYLTGLVQGYTCDAACGMINVWRENISIGFYHLLPLPYNDNSKSRQFMASAVTEFVEVLERAGGIFSEDALSESMDLYARIRHRLRRLQRLHHAQELPMPAADLFAVTAAYDIMPPKAYLEKLEAFTAAMSEKADVRQSGMPVLLSGSLIESDEVFSAVEAAGGRIAADDLCNGYRKINPPDGSGDRPMNRLIDRCMKHAPCPSRSHAKERAEALLSLMNTSDARGAIFVIQKFCTPHLADYPILSKILGERGYPTLLVEMDETWQIGGQLRTRLESFFEMLEGR